MSNTLLFLLALLLAILAHFFLLSNHFLSLFGRAQLRKLRENHRQLSERLEDVLEKKLVLRVALQWEAALCAAASVVLATLWFCTTTWPIWGRCTLCAVLFLLLEILQLLLQQQLPLPATARVIAAAVHPARLLAILGWPFQALEDKRDESGADDTKNTVTTEDAIRSLVEEDDAEESDPAAPEDDLKLEEKRMLTGVMNLDITLVHEIMTPRVDIDAISQDATVAEAKALIARTGHSRIPVYRKSIDAITGILYAKDLLDEEKVANAQAVSAFSRPPLFIPETKKIADLLKEFRSKHNHLAVVLDEYGGTGGIITIEDILEEIVGEIEDEYDRTQPLQQATPDADGALTVDARTTIWEINNALDLEIPEDEGYDTLAGYIMATLGRIPKTGEKVETPFLQAEILRASPRRLITLKIRRKAE